MGVIQVFGLPLSAVEPLPNELLVQVFGEDIGSIQEVPSQVIVFDEGHADQIITLPPVDVIVTAPQGPRGPPGADGAAGEASVVREAAQALGGQRVVKALDTGEVDYASSDQPDDGDLILGITKGAVNAHEDATVQTGGTMTDVTWTWIAGPVFCGLNGVLTQTVPTSGFVCRVAKALSASTILINVEEAIILA